MRDIYQSDDYYNDGTNLQSPIESAEVDEKCIWNGVQPVKVKFQDYLMIPRAAYLTEPKTIATYFCGTSLNAVTVSDCMN